MDLLARVSLSGKLFEIKSRLRPRLVCGLPMNFVLFVNPERGTASVIDKL